MTREAYASQDLILESTPPGTITIDICSLKSPTQLSCLSGVSREWSEAMKRPNDPIPIVESPSSGGAAEYVFGVARTGSYTLQVRYITAEQRITRITINGKEVTSSATNHVTALSWKPQPAEWIAWEDQWTGELSSGKNVVRFDSNSAFPYIFGIRLIPRNIKTRASRE